MIKKFENFNNSSRNPRNEVIDTVKDICLELEDDGYFVRHNLSNRHAPFVGTEHNEITINKIIEGRHTSFSPYDIKDVIYRLKEYLGSNWISLRVNSGGLSDCSLSIYRHISDTNFNWKSIYVVSLKISYKG